MSNLQVTCCSTMLFVAFDSGPNQGWVRSGSLSHEELLRKKQHCAATWKGQNTPELSHRKSYWWD